MQTMIRIFKVWIDEMRVRYCCVIMNPPIVVRMYKKEEEIKISILDLKIDSGWCASEIRKVERKFVLRKFKIVDDVRVFYYSRTRLTINVGDVFPSPQWRSESS